MNYDRIRRRGLEKVSAEIMLMCLRVNIRRYLSSIDENKKVNEITKVERKNLVSLIKDFVI